MKSAFYQFLKGKRELNVHGRLIASESIRGTDITAKVYGSKRFIPQEFQSPITTLLYGNKVATFVWLETHIAFVVESKEAAASYRNYFEMM